MNKLKGKLKKQMKKMKTFKKKWWNKKKLLKIFSCFYFKSSIQVLFQAQGYFLKEKQKKCKYLAKITSQYWNQHTFLETITHKTVDFVFLKLIFLGLRTKLINRPKNFTKFLRWLTIFTHFCDCLDFPTFHRTIEVNIFQKSYQTINAFRIIITW